MYILFINTHCCHKRTASVYTDVCNILRSLNLSVNYFTLCKSFSYFPCESYDFFPQLSDSTLDDTQWNSLLHLKLLNIIKNSDIDIIVIYGKKVSLGITETLKAAPHIKSIWLKHLGCHEHSFYDNNETYFDRVLPVSKKVDNFSLFANELIDMMSL